MGTAKKRALDRGAKHRGIRDAETADEILGPDEIGEAVEAEFLRAQSAPAIVDPTNPFALRDPSYVLLNFADIPRAWAAMAADGFVRLEGVELGPCELDGVGHSDSSYDERVGRAMSFCVDGFTYTLFEDPDDGYRSVLGASIIVRPGNRCSTRFDPVALAPRYLLVLRDDDYGQSRYAEAAVERGQSPDIISLCPVGAPFDDGPALSFGTDRSDHWYPACIQYFNAARLDFAKRLDLAAKDFVDALPAAPSRKAPRV